MNAAKITCTRCRGKGLTGHVVVYAGVPGTCFKCAGAGEVYKDKFYQAFAPGARLIGVTTRVWLNPDNPNNGVFKSICALGRAKDWEVDVEAALASGEFVPCWGGTVRVVELTEEQARRFFAKFGADGKVRVGDSNPEDGAARRRVLGRARAQAAQEQAA